jgi:hypothetical protein
MSTHRNRIGDRGDDERRRRAAEKGVRHALFELTESANALFELAQHASGIQYALRAVAKAQHQQITDLRKLLEYHGDFVGRPNDDVPF